MITENGWPSCGPDQLDNSLIPGTTERVSLQRGQPNTILKAFMADLNWYVESVDNGRGSDQDEGGWTGTNSVPTSNHLGGTAIDYNWSDHPMGPKVPDPAAGWQWSEIVGGPEEPRVRELLAYYEGTVYWGNDWTTPHDSMHFQMGYNTFGNPATQDFINRKINPDGTSKFRDFKQGATANIDLVQLLSQAMGGTPGVDYSLYTQLYARTLTESDCTTVLRIAMMDAQLGEESGGFRYMQEIADGSAYDITVNHDLAIELGNTNPGDGVKYKGRGPLQVTGKAHYAAFSQWAFDRGYCDSPTYFVDNPDQLALPEFGFHAVTWYWTVERPGLNAAADAGDLTTATKLVNGGLNGFQDRQFRYNNSLNMGDRLLNLQEGDDDPLSDPAVVQMITDLHNMFISPVTTQSRYKADGEGAIWTRGQMVQNDDGMTHESYVERLAVLGDPENVALVARNAAYTGEAEDPEAQSCLIRIDDMFLTAEQRVIKAGIITARFPKPSTI